MRTQWLFVAILAIVCSFCSTVGAVQLTNAYIWDHGSGAVLLESLGDINTPYRINNLGQVAGWSETPPVYASKAVVWDSQGNATDIGHLPGYEYARAYDINSSGYVVGTCGSTTTSGLFRSFIWDKQSGMTDLGVLPGFENCCVSSINDRGQIVGFCSNRFNEGPGQAFIWQRDTGMVPISSQYAVTIPEAINNSGEIVGRYIDPWYAPQQHAFLWNPLTGMQVLELSDGWSSAVCINDAHDVCVSGSTADNDGLHIWFRTADGLHDIGDLPYEVIASGMNSSGQIVGYNPAGGYKDAFMWDASNGFENLYESSNHLLWTAFDINDHGQITGCSVVPEPLTLTGFSIIGGWMFVYLRRRFGLKIESGSSVNG